MTTQTTHSKEQAYQLCSEVVKNKLASRVLVDKYLMCKTIDDKHAEYVETTPQQMWRRLAITNASAEKPEKREYFASAFYDILNNFQFVPGGRVMYGLGNIFVNVTLKNCYIFQIQDDSMKGVFDTGYWMAETYKGGGGCGLDISPLRPKNSPVNNAARVSGGAVGFMDFFSHITGMIGQKGRIGALLLGIDINHPDVEDFIQIKGGDDLNLVRYANISVKATDVYMQALIDGRDFELVWGGKVYKTIKARDLWNLIQDRAWKRAEPGVLFFDAVLRGCPSSQYPLLRPVCTNPCGEVPAGHGDSCNLGSLNMGKYVRKSWTKEAYFDEQLFAKHTRLATRFLDNIITLEKTPLDFQQAANDQGRRLGLGVMGLADVFLRMGIKYDSDQAIELSDKLMSSLRNTAYDESCNLAIEKGPFPAFELEKHLNSEFIKRLPEPIINKIKKDGIRNVANLSIAPTGTLAVIAEASAGIEPIFKIADYIRKTNLGTAKEVQEHVVSHDAVREYCELTGCKPDNLPDYFVGAHEVDNYKRLELQSTIQKYIDQAISNTFNLSKGTTPEEIGNLYIQAWRLGLKGITVYRDGSREGVLVDVKENKDTKSKIIIHSAPARPDSLDAKVHIIKPNGTTYTIFVGLMGERVFEVFALDQKLAGVADGMTGKIVRERTPTGNFYHFECGVMTVTKLNSNEDNEASLITRLVSTSLRHGVPLEFIIDQISKSKALINSFAKAIVKALSIYVIKEEMKGKFRCKNCGSDNIKIEGTCRTCHNCGESKCS